MNKNDILRAIAAILCELAINRSLPVGELYVLMMAERFTLDHTLFVARLGVESGLWTNRNHLLQPTEHGLALGLDLKAKLLGDKPVKQSIKPVFRLLSYSMKDTNVGVELRMAFEELHTRLIPLSSPLPIGATVRGL